MEKRGVTYYYLNDDKDFIALIDDYINGKTSILQPVSIIKKKSRDSERMFKLLEGEQYIIYEDGTKKYCYLKNEELVPLIHP